LKKVVDKLIKFIYNIITKGQENKNSVLADGNDHFQRRKKLKKV